MTAILELPLCEIEFVASDNEDWRDSVAFLPNGDPINVTGIAFILSVRANKLDNELLATLSTEEGTLVAGGGPDNNLLGVACPRDRVKKIGVGVRYVDCIAYAEGAAVRVIRGTLEVEKGIVQP